MEKIQAKSILSKLKNAPDSWFGITYNMNLYRGCQHQCIYCDSRSECYRIADFTNIQIKENALSLLELELKKKRLKATIGTGSMNDPYMPVEKQIELTRNALRLIYQHRFPVHVITKSALVVRDVDMLKDISHTYTAVSITITTADDSLSRIIEPGAPVTSERLHALKALSEAGIYCGVLIMPVLPFITDTAQNIRSIVEQSAKAGAHYMMAAMGVTLRDRQRDYYYQKLDRYFPGLVPKYQARFGEQYMAAIPDAYGMQSSFNDLCHSMGMATQMKFYTPPTPQQLSLF
ncbi:MAG TPA: radical SAM protein [Marinilabiliales bacterium]|nr:MAG: radical SAM protein [Bacteroidetes bacterium GWD2_40_43]OFX88307.1 MAG: radical SAM protein [Bacteroidetes bacterium GWE2_40_63]OFY20479.1 MAG: radical SAM protein [Bacteroidetes bacterium GWF2_40_13]OFZ32336.1 MAG: radical SAM protein [Bacteroidetes bacterium RIFOXYC2_FULL_40_12]HAM99986.1 radical SAM protein [Marinilabiliales bacterium]